MICPCLFGRALSSLILNNGSGMLFVSALYIFFWAYHRLSEVPLYVAKFSHGRSPCASSDVSLQFMTLATTTTALGFDMKSTLIYSR